MMQRYILIFWLVIYSICIWGQASQSLGAANAMVEKGDFQGAIEAYHSIISSGDISSELHYNLANTYLTIDSIASAVLHFEKALRISPHDEDIANNLEIAKSRVENQVTVLPEFFLISYWKKLYNALPANIWAILSLIFMIVITVIFYLSVYKGKSLRNRKMIALISGTLILFIISMSAGYARKAHDTTKKEAIIFEELFMKSGPDERSDDLKLLHPGFKIYIIDKLNGWNKIRTEDREIGWVQQEVYRII